MFSDRDTPERHTDKTIRTIFQDEFKGIKKWYEK